MSHWNPWSLSAIVSIPIRLLRESTANLRAKKNRPVPTETGSIYTAAGCEKASYARRMGQEMRK